MKTYQDENGKLYKLEKGDRLLLPSVEENKKLYPFFGFFNVTHYVNLAEKKKTQNKPAKTHTSNHQDYVESIEQEVFIKDDEITTTNNQEQYINIPLTPQLQISIDDLDLDVGNIYSEEDTLNDSMYFNKTTNKTNLKTETIYIEQKQLQEPSFDLEQLEKEELKNFQPVTEVYVDNEVGLADEDNFLKDTSFDIAIDMSLAPNSEIIDEEMLKIDMQGYENLNELHPKSEEYNLKDNNIIIQNTEQYTNTHQDTLKDCDINKAKNESINNKMDNYTDDDIDDMFFK